MFACVGWSFVVEVPLSSIRFLVVVVHAGLLVRWVSGQAGGCERDEKVLLTEDSFLTGSEDMERATTA